MKKAKVWDIQIRIFHWGLCLFTIYALISSGIGNRFGIGPNHTDPMLASHIAAGSAAILLILFRIFWGIKGSHYSRFSSLTLGFRKLSEYLWSVAKNRSCRYAGHNPAASWFAVTAIAISLAVFATGLLTYGIEESRGVFGFLHEKYYMHAASVKLSHYLSSCLLLIAILVHLAGVLLETARNGTDTAISMITGEKEPADRFEKRETGKVNVWVSYILIAISLGGVGLLYLNLNSYHPEAIKAPELYRTECGSCHMLFAPNMLPSGSWQKIMASLNDHFGDDASIGEAESVEISSYLIKNSAESSKREHALKVVASAGGGGSPASITETGYWKQKHDNISPALYRLESVKSRTNCVACHKWAEHGSFEDNDIAIPKT